jgi:hypothetical protein
MHTGDDQALHDYAEWVQAGYTRDTRPLLAAPQDPAVVSATKWLTDHMEVPEGILVLFRDQYAPGGPMLAVEPFRAHVLRNLRDSDPVGSVWVDDDSGVHLDFRLWTGPMPINRPEPGTKAPVRVCDCFAWNLATLPGFPKFDPFAPLEERDRAVAECARILKEKGDRLGRTIDTQAYWAAWLRGSAKSYESLLEIAFTPDRVLQDG